MGFHESCARSTSAVIDAERDALYDWMEYSDEYFCPQCGADTANPCGCVDDYQGIPGEQNNGN